MFNEIKKTLYFTKRNLLYQKGIKNGDIVPFDDELYKKLSNTFISGLPVSIHIKHLTPQRVGIGRCIDRSLYMFLCFDDALLVRGDEKNLELEYGKDRSYHGWIEKDNYVYDPYYLLRFDKDLYYKMFCPKKIEKYTIEDYKTTNKKYYEDIKNTTLDDFKINGRKRDDLFIIIPIIKETASLSNNEEFKKDLNDYLESIEYDEEQIYNQFMNKVKTLSSTK